MALAALLCQRTEGQQEEEKRKYKRTQMEDKTDKEIRRWEKVFHLVPTHRFLTDRDKGLYLKTARAQTSDLLLHQFSHCQTASSFLYRFIFITS